MELRRLGVFAPPADPFRRDPYPFYAEARGRGPLRWRRSRDLEGWAFFDHASVEAALSDGRLSSRVMPDEDLPMAHLVRRWIQFLDPPDHERLRKPLLAGLGKVWRAGLQARVEALASDLANAALARGEFDLIRDLALPLPVTVVAEMLGIPEADRPRIRRWAAAVVSYLDLGEPTADEDEVAAEMQDYFRHLWRKRSGSGPDLLSALPDDLEELDVVASCVQLLFAGHETTIHLIGNATLALARQPQVLERLRRNPREIPGAVEELIRFDSPVQLTNRVAAQPLEIQGCRVEEGDPVFLVLAAANRDPERFPEPDRLDLDRTERRHLGFGAGPHGCLGAAVARTETAAALRALLRAENLQVESEPEWQPTDFFRGFPSLLVQVS